MRQERIKPMIITLQSRPCPQCGVENIVDADGCHSCGHAFRCARVQVLEVQAAPAPKARPQRKEKSAIALCVSKIDALIHKRYDISTLKFD